MFFSDTVNKKALDTIANRVVSFKVHEMRLGNFKLLRHD